MLAHTRLGRAVGSDGLLAAYPGLPDELHVAREALSSAAEARSILTEVGLLAGLERMV